MSIPNGATHEFEQEYFVKKPDGRWYGVEESGNFSLLTDYKSDIIENNATPIIDNVNSPSHYTQGKVECIDAIESATVGKSGFEAYCVGNVIKYLWRYDKKGGKESVEKAKWHLEKLLEKMK